MDVNLIGKANARIRGAGECVIAVLEEDGAPHASVVSKLWDDGIRELRFATGIDADKVRRLRKDPRASVCFRVGGDNISLMGRVELLEDRESKRAVWQDWLVDHFPGGVDGPGMIVLRFLTDHVSLWVDEQGAMFDMREIATPQSRCGLLCHTCGWKESHGCGGCLETNGHPFHGECPVAKCCGEKELAHCGACSELPCAHLAQYSMEDAEHGDQPPGARIQLLRHWDGRPFHEA